MKIHIFYRYYNKIFIFKIKFYKYLRKKDYLLKTFIIISSLTITIIYLFKAFENLYLSKTFTNIITLKSIIIINDKFL